MRKSYKVTDILGVGGFGKVYKVYHQGWNVDLNVSSTPAPPVLSVVPQTAIPNYPTTTPIETPPLNLY